MTITPWSKHHITTIKTEFHSILGTQKLWDLHNSPEGKLECNMAAAREEEEEAINKSSDCEGGEEKRGAGKREDREGKDFQSMKISIAFSPQ